MLVLMLIEAIRTGWTVILILNLEVVTVKDFNQKMQMKLVLGMAEV